MVRRIRKGSTGRKRVRIGAPDGSLTPVAGMAAVSELVDRLRVVQALDAAVGRIKVRARGRSAGQLLVGMAAAQLAGEDFLVGLDRQRADIAGQAVSQGPPTYIFLVALLSVALGFTILAAGLALGATMTPASGDAFIATWTAISGLGFATGFMYVVAFGGPRKDAEHIASEAAAAIARGISPSEGGRE